MSTIKIRRSSTTGVAPSALADGELAINTADKKIFFKDSTGAIVSFKMDVPDVSSSLAGKSDTSHTHSAATGSVAGFMSAADKTKLDGVASGATAYSHPSGDGSHHVPATGTGNDTKVLKAGATAGSEAWGTVAFSELGTVPAAISTVAGLTPAADRLPYYTGVGGAALATFTATGRSLVACVDAAAVKTAISAADASHSHAISGVTGLQDALDAKLATSTAASTYGKIADQVYTGTHEFPVLKSALAGAPTVAGSFGVVTEAFQWKGTSGTYTAVPAARTVSAGTGISGGGDLTADRTLAFDATWGDGRYAALATFTKSRPMRVIDWNLTTTDYARSSGSSGGTATYADGSGSIDCVSADTDTYVLVLVTARVQVDADTGNTGTIAAALRLEYLTDQGGLAWNTISMQTATIRQPGMTAGTYIQQTVATSVRLTQSHRKDSTKWTVKLSIAATANNTTITVLDSSVTFLEFKSAAL